jgi:uncharacterized LabA/DUF88 family protein
LYSALLIDGGHLRVCFKKAGKAYTAENIESFAKSCFDENEAIYRIFYYDAPLYEGEIKTPISGEIKTLKNTDTLLSELSKLDHFAVRKGRLKFGGWEFKGYFLRKITEGTFTGTPEDKHFKPKFSQKGVDMVLGLDVAAIADTGRVDQFMLVTADTDMAPALKYGRVNGMKSVLIKPNYEGCFSLHHTLQQHSDIVRQVTI